MAETSGFFRSVSGDRKYTTDWLAKWVSSFISNGVYDGELAVTAGDGMTVTLPAGKAWINGYYYRNDAPITLPITNADGVLHRKDTIVLRWDVNERSITAQVIKGTFASSPTAPAITRSAEQYDLKLAEISIPAGTTAITQALITDTRLDTAVCGIVTGVIDQVDTTTFYNQIAADMAQFKSTQQADFEIWFNGIKGILGEDEAGNLLNMINGVSDDLGQHKSDTSAHISTALHTRTGTVNNLAVPDGAKNLTFLAAATIADGDSWTVNSQPVTAVLQNGEPLPGEMFKAGCWVTGVRLSDDGTQLYFSAGGKTQAAELHVLVAISGITVTAAKGSKTVSGVSGADGYAILYPAEFGEWQLSATISGTPVTQTLTIDAIAVFYTVLSAAIENVPWSVIDEVSAAGNAPNVWSVGDTKTITVDGVNYVAQIIGFGHDTKTAGGKAGITFQLQNCLATTYQMEATNINTNGWTNCAMRKTIMATLLSQLSSDLQNVIKEVNKLTSAGNQSATINTTADKLFLLSEIEIFGTVTNSKSGEGTQYNYYKAGNSKIKKVNSTASIWWERSPYNSLNSAFCCVTSSGSASFVSASTLYGVSFGFCV